MRSGLAVSFALAALGCAGTPLVGGPDAPSPELAAQVGARSEWLAPRAWAATSPDRPRALGGDRDRAVIDDDARALWLAFEAPASFPTRALLVLGVVDPATRRARETLVYARRVSDGAEVARARVLPGTARPIVLDVSAHAAGPLELSIHASEPLELATPRHLDRRARPRLELTVSQPATFATERQ